MDVTILIGISDKIILLAILSMTIRNIPPKNAVTGISLTCSGPAIYLAIWGTIRPIHATLPTEATEQATIKVLIKI